MPFVTFSDPRSSVMALAERGRWRSRRRWFPWRVRSRVGVAEGVWREALCVCACEREVCLGCVHELLFCVWLCA